MRPLVVIILAFVTVAAAAADVPARRYVVDLNAPARDRWTYIMRENIDIVPLIIAEAKAIMPTFLNRPLFWIAEQLLKNFPDEYAEEIRGIANVTGLPVGEIVGMNILYDITNFKRGRYFPALKQMACTSIVAEDSEGQILHARNLDYDMAELLRKATVTVDFVRDGEVMYTAPTFLMTVGVLTGQRPNIFTVSLNARYSGGIFDNLFMELFTRFRHPVSFELRQALENATSFDEAVAQLSKQHFIAPSYIVVGGTKSGEGAIITRNRWSTADVYRLNASGGRWFLLETNYDHWKEAGDPRQKMGTRYMNDVGRDNISPSSIYRVISKQPILNNLTIFSTVISASRPRLIHSYTNVRHYKP